VRHDHFENAILGMVVLETVFMARNRRYSLVGVTIMYTNKDLNIKYSYVQNLQNIVGLIIQASKRATWTVG